VLQHCKPVPPTISRSPPRDSRKVSLTARTTTTAVVNHSAMFRWTSPREKTAFPLNTRVASPGRHPPPAKQVDTRVHGVRTDWRGGHATTPRQAGTHVSPFLRLRQSHVQHSRRQAGVHRGEQIELGTNPHSLRRTMRASLSTIQATRAGAAATSLATHRERKSLFAYC